MSFQSRLNRIEQHVQVNDDSLEARRYRLLQRGTWALAHAIASGEPTDDDLTLTARLMLPFCYYEHWHMRRLWAGLAGRRFWIMLWQSYGTQDADVLDAMGFGPDELATLRWTELDRPKP